MLKKAGIVVAAAAAALLAVSPLAFAGDKDDHHGKGHGDKTEVENVNNVDESSEGLINVADNNLTAPIVACDNQVPVNVLGVQVPINDTEVIADLTGALGLGLLGGEGEADVEEGTNALDDSCHADGASSGDSNDQENEDD